MFRIRCFASGVEGFRSGAWVLGLGDSQARLRVRAASGFRFLGLGHMLVRG
jgi:hypothetical protein